MTQLPVSRASDLEWRLTNEREMFMSSRVERTANKQPPPGFGDFFAQVPIDELWVFTRLVIILGAGQNDSAGLLRSKPFPHAWWRLVDDDQATSDAASALTIQQRLLHLCPGGPTVIADPRGIKVRAGYRLGVIADDIDTTVQAQATSYLVTARAEVSVYRRRT